VSGSDEAAVAIREEGSMATTTSAAQALARERGRERSGMAEPQRDGAVAR
jgi:hypothetical protein